MRQRISQFLSNESTFGRLMTRVYILFGANLCFLLFSLPVLTMGPALAGLYYVCLRTLRSDGDISPWKEFWIGFKSSFKLSFLYELGLLLFLALAYVDLRFTQAVGGVFTVFRYAILALLFFVLLLTVHFFPVVAAFSSSFTGTLRNALFFSAKNPLRGLVMLGIYAFTFGITALDERMRPLYVFLWATVGFSGLAMICSQLLKKDFEKYLPKVDAFGFVVKEDEEDG